MGEDPNLTYNDIWGINRLVYSYLFGKTYYLGPKEILKIAERPAQSEETKIVYSSDASLSGEINNLNTVFIIPDNFKAGTTEVYLNGIAQYPIDDYNETGSNEITFTEAPLTNAEGTDSIKVKYIKAI